MGYLSERISYLRGLADGMNLSNETSEGRILKEIIEVLDDIAISVEELEDDFIVTSDDLENRCEDIEEFLFGDDDEDYYDEFDYDDEEEIDTITCPACKGNVTFSEDMINDDFTVFTCPSCGEEIELEWFDDDCCSDCAFCDHGFEDDEDEEDDEE